MLTALDRGCRDRFSAAAWLELFEATTTFESPHSLHAHFVDILKPFRQFSEDEKVHLYGFVEDLEAQKTLDKRTRQNCAYAGAEVFLSSTVKDRCEKSVGMTFSLFWKL